MNKTTRISEDDLFLYFIQRNLWPKMDFDDFKKQMEEKGVEIICNDSDDKNKR